MTGYMLHSLADIYAELSAGHPLPDIRMAGGEPLNLARIEYWSVLLKEKGLQHGDRLLLLTTPGTESIAVMVAAWHLGIVICPLPPQTREAPLRIVAEDCGAKAILDAATQRWQSGAAPDKPASFIYLTAPRVTGSDLALIIYSSGSTGVPKGIMLSHANVLSALRSVTGYLQLRPQDTLLSVPPLHFDYGLYQVLFGFYVGCRVILAPAACNPMQLLKLISQEQPTVLPLVPALGAGLAKLGNALKRQADCVRLITNTGGHMPEKVVRDLKSLFPAAGVMLMYGLTESKRAMFLPVSQAERKPDSVGKPMPGLEAKVFIASGDSEKQVFHECKPGEIGELYVRGASVMQGYTHPESSAGAQIITGNYRDDNWLATGDLFSYDGEGDFYFRGRAKELIKQAGFCLYPRTIEAIVEKHPQVTDCAVIGIHDEDGNEQACLFVRSAATLDKPLLVSWLSEHFDSPWLPARIEFIENWPVNQNGKINKKELVNFL